MPIPRILPLLVLTLATAGAAEPFVWQQVHAERKPGGDLAWQPRDVPVELGPSVRYIDYEGGDDAAAGTSPNAAWRHHPWDAQASGAAKACAGVHTYVFKRGVAYRGTLVADDDGTAQEPIRLTSSPDWGQGPALVMGSVAMTDGWSRVSQAPDGLPDAGKVWVREVRGMPQISSLFVHGAADAERVHLAREPDWVIEDTADPMSQWADWNGEERTTAQATYLPNIQRGDQRTWCFDPDMLTESAANAYEGATVWTEYAGLMGSPYPQLVEPGDYDPKRKAIRVGSPWMNGAYPTTHCRYFIEDHPRFLDQAGEYWHDVDGGKLYLRAPGDADPNTLRLELAATATQILLRDRSHIAISHLEFRHQRNPQVYVRFWDDAEQDAACVKILGSSRGISVRGCRFADVLRAVWMQGTGSDSVNDGLVIADNEMIRCDNDAIFADASGGKQGQAQFGSVDILRNRLRDIGGRPRRASHGHAIQVRYADEMTIAGNDIKRTFGSAIFVHGGKAGNGSQQSDDLTRILIFQNRVDETCMASNDWGGIETWQGGPAYVFDNVSKDPGGYWKAMDVVTDETWAEFNRALDQRYSWKDDFHMQQIRSVSGAWSRGRRNAFSAGFAFAYYCDGAFKQYQFNNIAQGRTSDLSSSRLSTGAFQAVGGSFLLTMANNTYHRFGSGYKRAGTYPGPDLFLGNVMEDIGDVYLHHENPRNDPKEDAVKLPNSDPEANAPGSDSQSLMKGWAGNVLSGRGLALGVIERSGRMIQDMADFSATAEKLWAIASDAGTHSDQPVLRDPANGDFRPRAGSPAADAAQKVFIPWGLAGTVGEWQFRVLEHEPWRVPGEHWHMDATYKDRGMYRNLPRHELQAEGVTTAERYVAGPTEGWTRSALQLDGADQRLILRDADLRADISYKEKKKDITISGADRTTPDMDTNSFLVETLLRIDGDADGGTLMAKEDGTGWRVALDERRRPQLVLSLGGNAIYTATAGSALKDASWHHLVVEFDRAQGARMYLDGKALAVSTDGTLPAADASLSNRGDLVAAAGLACTLDFLRVARSTLAESRTSIEELHAWQFDGPFLKTWWGEAIE